MRTFIALPLPSEIKDFLKSLQNELNHPDLEVKWVKPENIHLTLKFLGEIKEEKISLIKEIIDKVSGEISPFVISISSLDAFPNRKLPKVIWVGIEKGDDEIKKLAKRLEEETQKIGIPKEKRTFTSHLTLARLRSFKGLDSLREKLNRMSDYPLKQKKEFLAEKIILYKSTLTIQGPLYEEIYVRNLKTS